MRTFGRRVQVVDTSKANLQRLVERYLERKGRPKPAKAPERDLFSEAV